jgi:ADP-ribose pyrophosphatase YjhB (NUDIX family)
VTTLGRAHRLALELFRRLPVKARRRVVRTIAPSYTVGSICVIEREDGEVLLVRLSYRNSWGLPGGLLKRGESPEQAALREVKEESSLEVELVGDPAVVVDAVAQRVDVVFRARPAQGVDPRQAVASSPEIVEVGWFPGDALPDLQHEASGAMVALARRRVVLGPDGAAVER